MILRVPNTVLVSTGEVVEICRSTSTISPIDGNHARWGKQVDCRVTDPGSQARTIGYMGKMIGYSIKDVAGSFSSASADHSRALDAAAKRMNCGGGRGYKCKLNECKHRAHRRYGSRGKIVHVGRSWSYTGLTRANQRKSRAEWVAGLSPDMKRGWTQKVAKSARISLAIQESLRAELRYHHQRIPITILQLDDGTFTVNFSTGEILF